jgi:hypothetical protein
MLDPTHDMADHLQCETTRYGVSIDVELPAGLPRTVGNRVGLPAGADESYAQRSGVIPKSGKVRHLR